ncbi:hypothetical protein [Oleiagrimonas sp. C23AA]|uniref:hypothetical protein n=1 Tax=Oleiagrimonas sp. C23AA TaxID=2719047 RepID=UPI0014223D27|nr:hypothetical protein [Oleiagrimonas sp. C23AA]NII09602.1 hypothetical protein [Oleiagrimonas sp. C23AA]
MASSSRPPRYWFHAKRYGWGWALPARWQGWLSYIVAIVLVIAATRYLPLEAAAAAGLLVVIALFGLCAWKGAPAHWRWGGGDRD